VSEPARLVEILRALGFRPVFRYEKYRATFRWLDAELVIDETPIGTFLEIEGPPGTIHQATEGLGFSRGDAITDSYPALFSPGGRDMVFP
jgi:adenylate cyclase class 2